MDQKLLNNKSFLFFLSTKNEIKLKRTLKKYSNPYTKQP